jgi:hypothetical protein
MLCQRLGGDGIALQGAFDKPVKQFAARSGGSAVEPEGKLIEVIPPCRKIDSCCFAAIPQTGRIVIPYPH